MAGLIAPTPPGAPEVSPSWRRGFPLLGLILLGRIGEALIFPRSCQTRLSSESPLVPTHFRCTPDHAGISSAARGGRHREPADSFPWRLPLRLGPAPPASWTSARGGPMHTSNATCTMSMTAHGPAAPGRPPPEPLPQWPTVLPCHPEPSCTPRSHSPPLLPDLSRLLWSFMHVDDCEDFLK